MDVLSKLAILADAAKYDASCASSGARRTGRPGGLGNAQRAGICHSYTPDGRCVSLLKVLLTNRCVYDCAYCINRASSNVPRARFTVDEVVRLTLDFYRRNYIEGLFLSSGVLKSPDRTMEELSAVAERLRTVHGYRGYIHLKAVPGASDAALAAAGRWADRLSANIELPTAADLVRLAPAKTMTDVEDTMARVRRRIDAARAERREAHGATRLAGRLRPRGSAYAPAGQSTQMIVGATPSPDRVIIATASRLYRRFRLRRVYYSAFSPIPEAASALPVKAPPLVREHRLYQADWLLRHYGFSAEELTTPEDPSLDLQIDPKLAWALRNRDFFPVDLNRASRRDLLRVPGIGSRSADALVRARRYRRVRLEDLGALSVAVAKVAPFVITADPNPALRRLDTPTLREEIIARASAAGWAKRLSGAQLDLFDPPRRDS